MTDAQHGEITATREPDLGGVDGGAQVVEHNHVGALVEGHLGKTFHLGSLFIHDDVVDVTFHKCLTGGRRCGGERGHTQSEQQSHEGCGEEELFEGGLGSNHDVGFEK